MDQDQRFDSIIARMENAFPMTPMDIAPELAEPKSFLKVLRAKHYNWKAEKFSKLFGMRFSVKLPPLEQLNTIFYPAPGYDFPIFIFFSLVTKRKVIAHLNVNCPFDDPEYHARYVQPLAEIVSSYPSFETKDRYPEWMKKYRNSSTIYGLFPGDRADDISNCAFEYLDKFIEIVSQAEKISDIDRRADAQRFQDQFRDDIRTQDKAQGMIAKMIGAKTARRIFYEVTT